MHEREILWWWWWYYGCRRCDGCFARHPNLQLSARLAVCLSSLKRKGHQLGVAVIASWVVGASDRTEHTTSFVESKFNYAATTDDDDDCELNGITLSWFPRWAFIRCAAAGEFWELFDRCSCRWEKQLWWFGTKGRIAKGQKDKCSISFFFF